MGDPGIEPGVRLREGVTVPCHTLRPVAHAPNWRERVITRAPRKRQARKPPHGAEGLLQTEVFALYVCWPFATGGVNSPPKIIAGDQMKKPKWVVEKERSKKAAAAETVWLFGLHAVRDALLNPRRERLRLIVTLNAQGKLAEAIEISGMTAEVVDPRKFSAPLDPGSVHQGAALEVKPLDWGQLADHAIGAELPRLILLDRVTDPHNVGAILRSAEVLGAQAVIGTRHHSAPETGALAKTASGALERQPYLRVRNLAETIVALQGMGYFVLGLDGEVEVDLETALAGRRSDPVALVLGAEGPGLREKTKDTCDQLVRIAAIGNFGSLNVSNAAAVALYASQIKQT